MQAILPIEVYEALEKNIGHDDAKIVLKSFETAISANIEYTWMVTKDDLLSEMEKKFATKSDLMLVRAEIQQVKTELNGRIDSLETELNGRIDSLEARLNGRIDSLEARIDGKIDKLKIELSSQSKLHFIVILFVIFTTNSKALELISKIFINLIK
jgi:hypothetical protein